MDNDLKKLRRVIKQNILNEVKSKECLEKFGNYLFGEFKKWYGKEVEKDTPFESELWDKLLDFIRGEYENKRKDKILINGFKLLKKCKNEYSDILIPENVDIIYRGIYLETPENVINKLEGNLSQNNKIFTYNASSKIQSWADDKEIAHDFATFNRFDWGIILKTKPPKNEILFNSYFLNDLIKYVTSKQYKEEEIIRVSDKPIKCEYQIVDGNNIIKDFNETIDKKRIIEKN